MKVINLPDSVEIIDGYVAAHGWPFVGTGTTSFNISPNSKLTTLRSECFASVRCSNIFIPKSVTRIDKSIFYSSNIASVTIDKDNTIYRTDGKSIYSGENNSTLVVVVRKNIGQYIIPDYINI